MVIAHCCCSPHPAYTGCAEEQQRKRLAQTTSSFFFFRGLRDTFSDSLVSAGPLKPGASSRHAVLHYDGLTIIVVFCATVLVQLTGFWRFPSAPHAAAGLLR